MIDRSGRPAPVGVEAADQEDVTMFRRSLGRSRGLVLALALTAIAAPAFAQTDPQPASTSGSKADAGPAGRLFLGFDREAVLVDRQSYNFV